MKFVKVQAKYRVNGYPIKYKTKTIKMELPVDEHGFTLAKTLNKNIHEFFKKEDPNYYNLIWHKIVKVL